MGLHLLIETLTGVKDWLVSSCFGDVCGSSSSSLGGTGAAAGSGVSAGLDYSNIFGPVDMGYVDGMIEAPADTRCMISSDYFNDHADEEDGSQHTKDEKLLYTVVALLTDKVHLQGGQTLEPIPIRYKVLNRMLKYDPMLNSMRISACQNDGNFSDSLGFKCADYDQDSQMCQSASQRAVQGADASSRCCACGRDMEHRALGRHSHGMASLGLDIYVHSGCADEMEDCQKLHDDFVVYKTRQNEWITLVPGPNARYGHTLTCVGSDLLLFGGRTQSGLSNQLWNFSAGLWSLLDASYVSGSPPSARYRHATAVIASTVYIYGGQGPNGAALNDLYALDSNFVWRQLPSEPSISGRFGHLLVSIGSKLHVMGGIPTARSGRELASYDSTQQSWDHGTSQDQRGSVPLTSHWQGLTGIEVGGRVLAFASWPDNLASDLFGEDSSGDDGSMSLSASLFLSRLPYWAALACEWNQEQTCFGWYQSSGTDAYRRRGSDRLYDVWAQRGPSLLVAPVDHKVFVGNSLALAVNQLQFDQDLLVLESEHAPLVESGDIPHLSGNYAVATWRQLIALTA